MYNGLVHLHNILRWVIILLLLIVLIRHLVGMTGKRPFTSGDKKTGLFLMIAAHIQFLLGLYQWFVGPWGYKLIKNAGGFGEIMKNPVLRFWTIEHNTGMLIAIILITAGRNVSKKNLPDYTKHKRSYWLFLIALILIIISVPWPDRGEISRPLLPGMGR